MAMHSVRDGVNLDLAGVLKAAFSDCPLEIVLEEEIVPACQIGPNLIVCFSIHARLLIFFITIISRKDVVHADDLKTNLIS